MTNNREGNEPKETRYCSSHVDPTSVPSNFQTYIVSLSEKKILFYAILTNPKDERQHKGTLMQGRVLSVLDTMMVLEETVSEILENHTKDF